MQRLRAKRAIAADGIGVWRPGALACSSGSGSEAWSRTRAGGTHRVPETTEHGESGRRSIANCQPDSGPMGAPLGGSVRGS